MILIVALVLIVILVFFSNTEHFSDNTEKIRQAIKKTVAEGGNISIFRALINDDSFSALTFAALMAAERNRKLTYDITKGIIGELAAV
jgi:hypothetical protein